jgi:dihydrofolate synthase/folylpolyglutamate synthase
VNFDESLQYLYNLGYELSVRKFGLENSFRLLEALNNPEKNYLKIQVAGTNGKGSVCAFLSSICVSAKIKTGLYTSPHLISVTERIKIDGEEISEKDFARIATKIREISEKLVESRELDALPTFFEQLTAIALQFFAEEKAEIAILETGIGGRFDATTAANAEIAAITPIDFDHQNILGNTLSEIASEKAAIIRAGSKVVLAEQKSEAAKIISARSANFNITPKLADFTSEIRSVKNGKFTVDFKTGRAEYKNVCLNLRGKHQIENSKVAVLLAETLQENFRITPENIIEGLQAAVHKGRLEFYKNFLFDGAHNASGAKALREFLDEFNEQPVTMIFGAMKDKDLGEIAEILFPKAEKLIFTKPDNPRSLGATELLNFAPKNFDKENLFVTNTVEEALKKALEISSGNDLICVTGSLYLVGEAQKILSETSPSF